MSDHPIEMGFIDVNLATIVPPQWVINETVPVGLTVMSGPPKKAFKSLQSILYAAACANWDVPNLPIWMQPVRTGPSLLVSYEAEAGVIKYILENDCEIQTQPGAMWIAHKPFEFQLDNPDQANQLLDFMEEKDPIVTVIDTFRNSHSGDENDSGNVIQLLSPLVQWTHAHQSAVILVHHVNKPTEGKDGSSFYAMRGSSALPGLADGLLNIQDTKVEGEIILNATFKRGLSYQRKIHLGIPGYGWGARGYEVLSPLTLSIGQEWDKGNHSVESIATVVKRPPMEVKAALEDLRRNHAI